MFKRKVLLAIQFAFYAAAIWFIVQRFDELAAAVNPRTLLDRPHYVLLSALFFLTFYGIMSVHWKLLCDRYVSHKQQKQWLAYFASQPYKYLPTSAFAFSSRALYAKKLGLPLKQSSVVQAVENLNLLFACACVSVIFLAYSASVLLGLSAALVFIAGVGAASLIKSLKVPKTAFEIPGREWVRLFLLPCGAWIFAGAAFYFLVLATGQRTEFVSAVAANAIAVGLGIVAVFAPGGIGVREYVYDKFQINSAGIVMWRFLTLIIDVLAGGIAIYLMRRQPDDSGT